MSGPSGGAKLGDNASNAIPFGKPFPFAGQTLAFSLHPRFLRRQWSRQPPLIHDKGILFSSIEGARELQEESFPVRFSASTIQTVLASRIPDSERENGFSNDFPVDRSLADVFVVNTPKDAQSVYATLSSVCKQEGEVKNQNEATKAYMRDTLGFSPAEINAIDAAALSFGDFVKGNKKFAPEYYHPGGIIRVARLENILSVLSLSQANPGAQDYVLIEKDQTTGHIRIHSKIMTDAFAYEAVFLLRMESDDAFTVELDEKAAFYPRLYVDKAVFENTWLPILRLELGNIKAHMSDREKFYLVISNLIPYLSHKAFRDAFDEQYKTFSPALRRKIFDYLLINNESSSTVIEAVKTARRCADLTIKEIDLLMQLVLQTQEILLSSSSTAEQLLAYKALVDTMTDTFKSDKYLLQIISRATALFCIATLAVGFCALFEVFGAIPLTPLMIGFFGVLAIELAGAVIVKRISNKLIAFESITNNVASFWETTSHQHTRLLDELRERSDDDDTTSLSLV